MSGPTPKKDKLLLTLAEARAKSRQVQKEAQDIVETTQMHGSLAGHLEEVIGSAPDDSVLPDERWDQLNADWTEYQVQLGNIFVGPASSSTTTATGSAATLTTALTEPHFSGWVTGKATRSLAEMHSILHRPTLLEEAVNLLRSHSIGSQGDSRSPPRLLAQAHESLIRPSSQQVNPTAVLVTARSAIDALLAELLRRRGQQERARGISSKIMSIGRQMGIDGIPIVFFERLGQRAEELQDRLSEAKTRDLDLAEVSRRFDEALTFIISIFKGLDPKKSAQP
jgi:hypothetical protein